MIEAWERWSPDGCPTLVWSAEACRRRWSEGLALLSGAPPDWDREAIEPLLEPVLEELAGLGGEAAEGIDRFARAWDEGRLGPADLLPGVLGRGAPAPAAPADVLGLIAYLGLRPPVESYLAPVHAHFSPEDWDGGACPFCDGLACFAEIADDGRRWLYCALCGGRWIISRLRCPFCDNRDARTLARLSVEGEEEGYLVETCDVCRGYVKGVDRRLRWDLGPPLLEDWGTPHLDLIAHRREYWRATPSLVQLAAPKE